MGSHNGEARAWQTQVIKKAKACRRATRAWDKLITAAEAERRRTRLAVANRDEQHRQEQLRKQQEPKQGRARQQQSREVEHARRRMATAVERDTEEEGVTSTLEEVEKAVDKKDAKRLLKHKATREGNMALWKKTKKDVARKTAKQIQARISS